MLYPPSQQKTGAFNFMPSRESAGAYWMLADNYKGVGAGSPGQFDACGRLMMQGYDIHVNGSGDADSHDSEKPDFQWRLEPAPPAFGPRSVAHTSNSDLVVVMWAHSTLK